MHVKYQVGRSNTIKNNTCLTAGVMIIAKKEKFLYRHHVLISIQTLFNLIIISLYFLYTLSLLPNIVIPGTLVYGFTGI